MTAHHDVTLGLASSWSRFLTVFYLLLADGLDGGQSFAKQWLGDKLAGTIVLIAD